MPQRLIFDQICLLTDLVDIVVEAGTYEVKVSEGLKLFFSGLTNLLNYRVAQVLLEVGSDTYHVRAPGKCAGQSLGKFTSKQELIGFGCLR